MTDHYGRHEIEQWELERKYRAVKNSEKSVNTTTLQEVARDMSKEANNIDLDDDFGFTLEEVQDTTALKGQIETTVESYLKFQKEANDAVNRISLLMNEIDKLLKNLEKNPEKEMIKWPNRQEKIKLFRQKLNKIAWE